VKSKMNLMLVTTAPFVSRTQLNAVYEDCLLSDQQRKGLGTDVITSGNYTNRCRLRVVLTHYAYPYNCVQHNGDGSL
jgi:hypothetical protein